MLMKDYRPYSPSDQNRRHRINYDVESDAHDNQMRDMYDHSGEVNTIYKSQNQGNDVYSGDNAGSERSVVIIS